MFARQRTQRTNAASLFIGGALFLAAGDACTGADDRNDDAVSPITATTGFPVLRTTLAVVIPDSAIPVSSIGAITAGPDGTIVIADHNAMSLVLFDSTGTQIRSVGGKGSGPGEFERIGPVGWIGDTLVVLDVRLRRVTFFAVPNATVQIATWPSGLNGWPWHMFTTSGAAVAVIGESHGEPVPIPFGGTTMRRIMHYVPITTSGVGVEFHALRSPPELRRLFPVCDDGAGSTHFDIGPFRELGPLDGMTARGQLVTVAPDSLVLTIRGPHATDSVVTIKPRRAHEPVSDETWNLEASEYLALKAKHPALRCEPPYIRPQSVPGGRMLQVDESDRIWIEVSEQGGTSMHILRIDGSPIGVFRMPAHDQTVPWFVRANRLYTVSSAASGVQEVRVYGIAN
jgi:hypothetical protein